MKNFDKEGFIESEWLKTIIPTTEAEFYFCGSVAFMKHINAALTDLSVKQEHIHYEFFSSKHNKQKRGIYFTSFLFVLVINGLLFHGVYLSVSNFGLC